MRTRKKKGCTTTHRPIIIAYYGQRLCVPIQITIHTHSTHTVGIRNVVSIQMWWWWHRRTQWDKRQKACPLSRRADSAMRMHKENAMVKIALDKFRLIEDNPHCSVDSNILSNRFDNSHRKIIELRTFVFAPAKWYAANTHTHTHSATMCTSDKRIWAIQASHDTYGIHSQSAGKKKRGKNKHFTIGECLILMNCRWFAFY